MTIKNTTSCEWHVWFVSTVEEGCNSERTVSEVYNIAANSTVTFPDFTALAWNNGMPSPANDWDQVFVLNPCHGTNINYATACSMNGAFEGMLLATGACSRPINRACVDITPCGSCNYVYGDLSGPSGGGWLLEIYQ